MEYYREYTWSVNVPNPQAIVWSCKYFIHVADELNILDLPVEQRGYIHAQIEMFGFDQ